MSASMASVLTLPMAMLISGLLYFVFIAFVLAGAADDRDV